MTPACVATLGFPALVVYFLSSLTLPGHSRHQLVSKDSLCVLPLAAALHPLTAFPLTARTLKVCSVSGGSPLFVKAFALDVSQVLLPSTSIW